MNQEDTTTIINTMLTTIMNNKFNDSGFQILSQEGGKMAVTYGLNTPQSVIDEANKFLETILDGSQLEAMFSSAQNTQQAGFIFAKSTANLFNHKKLDAEQSLIDKKMKEAEYCLIVLNHEIQVNGANDPITKQAKIYYQSLQTETIYQTELNKTQRDLFNMENNVELLVNQQSRTDGAIVYNDVKQKKKTLPTELKIMIDILPEPITSNTKIVERCNNNKQFHQIREQFDKLNDLKDIYDLKEKQFNLAFEVAEKHALKLIEMTKNVKDKPQYVKYCSIKSNTNNWFENSLFQLYEQKHKPLIDQSRKHEEQLQKQMQLLKKQIKNKQARELYEQRKLQETFNRVNKQTQNEILQTVPEEVKETLKTNYKPLPLVQVKQVTQIQFIDINVLPLYLDIQHLIYKQNLNKIKKGFELIFKVNCPKTLAFIQKTYLEISSQDYDIDNIYHLISSENILKRTISNLVLTQNAVCNHLSDNIVFYMILDICIGIQRVIQIRIRELHIHAFKGDYSQFQNHQSAVIVLFELFAFIKIQVLSSSQLNVELQLYIKEIFNHLNITLDAIVLFV